MVVRLEAPAAALVAVLGAAVLLLQAAQAGDGAGLLLMLPPAPLQLPSALARLAPMPHLLLPQLLQREMMTMTMTMLIS